MLGAPLLLQVAMVTGAMASPAATLRAVVVGGGPEPAMNQIAIERNVRWFDALLPPEIERRVLFADGSRERATVQLLEEPRPGRASVLPRLRYVRPSLRRIDGPTTEAGFAGLLGGFVAERPADPLLLYFAGHGSRDSRGNLDDNQFDLWGGGGLHVRQLAAKIAELPKTAPVIVVMAQCYSGAFANLLFEGGRPNGAVVERDLVGFFAATADRPASGCTPDVNEATYQDFSTFFFAALTGTDRLGHRVEGVDFDNNGSVGMDEAFAYAVLAEDSEDVPVSTADAFLRRFVEKPDAETMATPYAAILGWATPAQRAALEGLSKRLRLSGEQRLQRAYDAYFRPGGRDAPGAALRLRFVRLGKSVVLARDLEERGDPKVRARFARLRAAEGENPLRQSSAPRPAALSWWEGPRRLPPPPL